MYHLNTRRGSRQGSSRDNCHGREWTGAAHTSHESVVQPTNRTLAAMIVRGGSPVPREEVRSAVSVPQRKERPGVASGCVTGLSCNLQYGPLPAPRGCHARPPSSVFRKLRLLFSLAVSPHLLSPRASCLSPTSQYSSFCEMNCETLQNIPFIASPGRETIANVKRDASTAK